MTLKEHEYVRQTLERYTNCRLEDFCDHIIITNFKRYILRFQEKTKASFPRATSGSPMPRISTAP